MNKSRTQQTRGKIYEDFGNKIKQLRIEKNLTQDELSKLIGISRTNIGQYETGVRKVPLNIIKQFSSFFDISVDELLDINIEKEEASKTQITKYEVASEMGFTKEEISILQSGVKEVPKYFFEKFANYFDVDVNSLTGLKLDTEREHAVITTDNILTERYKKWQKEVGYDHFTEEEIDQLIDYAKYLISKRK